MSLAELGRFAEAARYEAEVIQLAEPTQHAHTIGCANLAASMLHLVKGEWAKALSRVEAVDHMLLTGKSPSCFRGRSPPPLGPWRRSAKGARRGTGSGRASSSSNVRRREGSSAIAVGLMARWVVPVCCSASSKRRGAWAIVRSNPLGASLASRPMRCYLLGEIASHPDRFDAESGAAHYREALALAQLRGMRPLVAHCHLGLGKLYRRIGETEHARENLAAATTMYREMDMGFWLEQGRRV